MGVNKKPSVFVGSSTEGAGVAREVQHLLEGEARVVLWSQGVFGLSRTYIESLCEAGEEYDFAVLVLTPDDKTVSRRRSSAAPRDNVLFELGLFIGSLGRDRCFLVYEEGGGLKLPSDLLGVTGATYAPHDPADLPSALAAPCARIRGRIGALGPRRRLDRTLVAAHEKLADFCAGISGHWWEHIKPVEPSALSFVKVWPDPATGMVKMHGRAYDRQGEHAATWDTVATCVNFAERKVFYYWKGWHPSRPAEPFEGFGEITFEGPAERADSGAGVFSDTNLTDLRATTKKSFTLRRCDPREARVMEGDDEGRISELVAGKFKRRA